ncbi:hypothetical protein EPK84_12340 (plasmid) [Sinorhizobium fredii]|nr:hypothetical protein EPK84_12340 [Sinorhizobium fredii]
MKSADRVPIKLTRSKRLENVGLIQSPVRPVCHHCSATTKMRRSVNQDETRQQRWNAERA